MKVCRGEWGEKRGRGDRVEWRRQTRRGGGWHACPTYTSHTRRASIPPALNLSHRGSEAARWEGRD
jgi:hypothetical protein